jgi:hypothetical protein
MRAARQRKGHLAQESLRAETGFASRYLQTGIPSIRLGNGRPRSNTIPTQASCCQGASVGAPFSFGTPCSSQVDRLCLCFGDSLYAISHHAIVDTGEWALSPRWVSIRYAQRTTMLAHGPRCWLASMPVAAGSVRDRAWHAHVHVAGEAIGLSRPCGRSRPSRTVDTDCSRCVAADPPVVRGRLPFRRPCPTASLFKPADAGIASVQRLPS